MATIAATEAQVLFAPYYYDTVGPKIVPQAREAGYTGAIIGADGFDGTQDYAVGDLSAYNDVYFTNHYSPEDPSEKVQTFIANYTAAYGAESLNALAALAYDAMYMVAQAIETAGSTDRDRNPRRNGWHALCRRYRRYDAGRNRHTREIRGNPDLCVEQDGVLVQKFVTSQQ